MASKRLSLLVCNIVNDRGYKMGKPSSSSGKKKKLSYMGGWQQKGVENRVRGARHHFGVGKSMNLIHSKNMHIFDI